MMYFSDENITQTGAIISAFEKHAAFLPVLFERAIERCCAGWGMSREDVLAEVIEVGTLDYNPQWIKLVRHFHAALADYDNQLLWVFDEATISVYLIRQALQQVKGRGFYMPEDRNTLNLT